MDVAYHSSDKFAPVLGVSITSLFENNGDADRIRVFVLGEGIGPENRERLSALASSYGREIHVIPMPDINARYSLGLRDVRPDWFFNSYSRLFLHDILPRDVDRVLYLDSDTLVLSSLEGLWGVDFGQCCFAAVIECLGSEYKQLFSIPDSSPYYNSGVLMEDLEALRGMDVAGLVRRYASERGGYVFFMEQTVLNAVFGGSVKTLPPMFNCYSMIECLSFDELMAFRRPDPYYSREEVDAAREDPAIAHLTNFFLVENRAWVEGSSHPLRAEYLRYKGLSPWRDVPDAPDGRGVGKRAMDRLVRAIPRRAAVRVAGSIDRSLRARSVLRTQKRFMENGGGNRLGGDE